MFYDPGTDVILQENGCSGSFRVRPDTRERIAPGTEQAVDALVRDLNGIFCKWYSWILLPLMILGVVAVIVVLAVVPYNPVKIAIVFVAIIVITLSIPCISYCCGKRVNTRAMGIVESHSITLRPTYQLGFESFMIIDRYGRQFPRQSGNLLLRRTDLAATIAVAQFDHPINNGPIVRIRNRPEAPQPPIPIYQFEAHDGEKAGEIHIPADVPLPTQENQPLVGDFRESDHPLTNPNSVTNPNLMTDQSEVVAMGDGVHPYQIPVHPGVAAGKSQKGDYQAKHV